MRGESKNNFDQRGGELMPRELMERAADPALVPDEALVAVLLKTGSHGLNVIELSRRLIEASASYRLRIASRTFFGASSNWSVSIEYDARPFVSERIAVA